MDEKKIFNTDPPPPQPEATPSQPIASMSSSSNGLLKKLIIGLVVVMLVVILIILFLPKSSSKKVNLLWWGLWEDSRVMQSVIADFEKENPSITVEYIKQDPKQYRERLTTRIANGKGPDIFRFHNTWYSMINTFTSPLPVDVITADDFKKTYYPVMVKDMVHNGAIYGIPSTGDTISLFVNTELLNAAGLNVPTNWDEFVKDAKTLTVKDENGLIKTSGAALGTYSNVMHAADIVSLLFAQQGIDFTKFSSFQSDQLDVINFYTSFAKGDDKTWDDTLDNSLISFSQGKLAMYFGYSWDIFTIQRLNKDLAFTVHSVPNLFNRKTTIASYWAEGVSNKSMHQKEAYLFMRYLLKKETVQKLYTEQAKTRSFGALYARRDLGATLKDNSLVYPFVSQLNNATSSFFASDTNDGDTGLNSSSNKYLENAINAIISDGSSSDTVLTTLNEGVKQVLSKYGVQ